MWVADGIGKAVFICSTMADGNMRHNVPLQGEFLDRISAPPVGRHLLPRTGGWGVSVKRVQSFGGRIEADSMIIKRSPQFRLTMLPGDCPPIILVDEGLPALALIHGSKDALERGVIPRTLGAWRRMGGNLARTTALVGPGIRSCCYRFPKSEAKRRLRKWPAAHMRPEGLCGEDGFWSVSLQGLIGEQLSAGGLGSRFIIASECTCCEKDEDGGFLFPSHRRSTVKEEPESRFLAVAWLK